jgi:uncharacterized membrane protein/predicted flap endonuclease-1-like 5' DNA nuclease
MHSDHRLRFTELSGSKNFFEVVDNNTQTIIRLRSIKERKMSEKYIFIIIKYPKADTAIEALAALRELMHQKIVSLKDAVAVTKTEMGEIILHRSQDDVASEDFLNGDVIGIIFADLFGSAGWDTYGAFAGTAFELLGQGIKDDLLNEFGEKMTPGESAVATLVERADWRKAVERMRVHNFQGKMVIAQNVIGDLANVEKLLDDEKIIVSVPEKMEVRPSKGLKYIEGIGDVYRQKLRQAGITNVDELLDQGSTVQGRNEIVNRTGISEKLLLRWINEADLYRINGIGQEYAELLEAAGVDTVPELAQRVPANLLEKMAAANAQKKMVRRLPDLSQVESWVAQAKSLPRVINY